MTEPGLQLPLLFGVIDHSLGDTVLYTAGWIEIFQFAQNFGFQAFGLFNMNQFQQRCLSNQLIRGCIDLLIIHSSSMILVSV